MKSMEVQVLLRKCALKLSQFLKGEKLALRKLGMEQIFHALRYSLGCITYALKHS